MYRNLKLCSLPAREFERSLPRLSLSVCVCYSKYNIPLLRLYPTLAIGEWIWSKIPWLIVIDQRDRIIFYFIGLVYWYHMWGIIWNYPEKGLSLQDVHAAFHQPRPGSMIYFFNGQNWTERSPDHSQFQSRHAMDTDSRLRFCLGLRDWFKAAGIPRYLDNII